MLKPFLMENIETKAGFIALVGRPNVGKSTLLNAILGQKLAIVSHRPQTTRNRILGVKTTDDTQMVMLDTPGIHQRRSNINQYMVREAFEAIEGVDCALLVTEVDPKSLKEPAGDELPQIDVHPNDRYVLNELKERQPNLPLIVVINKIDKLKDRRLVLPLMDRWRQDGFERILPISAKAEDGIELIISEIQSILPQGPFFYPEDMLTDRAERFLAAEVIREQVFLQCHEEIPYSTAVEIDSFEERSAKKDIAIEATIFIEKETQKGILVGAKGSRIKAIGIDAREALSKLMGCPVHIRLTVRVSRDWTKSMSERRRFGYE